MSNEQQRTVLSGGGWPPDSASGPTQLAGSGGTEDRPTPKTIPADDLRAWSPPPAAPPPPPSGPESFPFRPTPGPAATPPPPPPQPAGGQTVLMRTEPEPKIPLAWLVVVEGPGNKRGTTFLLKSETIVGRTYGDCLLGGDATVSSQHAKVRLEPKEGVEGEEIFVLYDLASANGTFVGAKQTYRDEGSRVYRRELQDGDYILLGETTLVFKQVD